MLCLKKQRIIKPDVWVLDNKASEKESEVREGGSLTFNVFSNKTGLVSPYFMTDCKMFGFVCFAEHTLYK